MATTPTLNRFQIWFQRIPILRSRRNLIILGLIALVVIIVVQLLTGQPTTDSIQPPALESPTGSEGHITVTFEGVSPSYPDRLPTYQLQASTPLVAGARSMAQQLGLSQDTQGDSYSSAQGDVTLTILPGNQGLYFSDQRNTPIEGTLIDPTVARRHAENFLQTLGFQSEQYQINDVYVSGEEDADSAENEASVPASQAIGVISQVTQTLRNYPLRWEAGNVGSFSILSTNRGVNRASWSNFPLQYELLAERQTYTVDEIRQNIQSGGYVIVGTVGRGADRGRLVQLRVQQAEVEYRVSQASQSVRPHLLLTGDGRFADGQVFELRITTPLTP